MSANADAQFAVTVVPEWQEYVSAIHAAHVASFPTPAEADLVDALRASGHLAVSLVALVYGEVAGHIAFSPVTAGAGASGLGLAPVAVLPALRSRGIGGELVREGLSACAAAGCGWVVVLGAPAYYRRFGFVPASAFGLADEYGGGPAFQVLELAPGALPRDAGLVRYGREFADL